MPQKFWTLQILPKPEIPRFQDPETLLSQPDFYVFAPSLTQAMRIRPYLNGFKSALVGQSVYPPDLEISEPEARLDTFLFRRYRPYFQQLADLVGITIDLDLIESASRHAFFVCTKPIPHWDDPSQQIPGLSGLEQLLGLSYPESGGQSRSSAIAEEKDNDAYLMAALVLNFPNTGLELADRFDVPFLSEILKEAAILSGGEAKSTTTVVNRKPKLVKDEQFESEKQGFAQVLAQMNVIVPPDF